jgi:arylsulfatase A-like enzyme
VSYIDSLIGHLLLFLEKLGLAENTIVILWGDHGYKLGEHGSWGKRTNYETDTRSPLIVRVPGAAGNGQISQRLVEFVDIYPTLCDLADFPQPGHLEGKSMAPLLQNPQMEWKDEAFSQYYRRQTEFRAMGYTIRTDRYRYVEWRNWENGEIIGEELYDHLEDPQENTNIAGRPENSTTIKNLRGRLRATCPIQKRSRAPLIYAQSSETPVVLEAVNRLKEDVTVFELDRFGARQWIQDLRPNKTIAVDTFLTHPFVFESKSGNYYRVIFPDYPQRRVVLESQKRR